MGRQHSSKHTVSLGDRELDWSQGPEYCSEENFNFSIFYFGLGVIMFKMFLKVCV